MAETDEKVMELVEKELERDPGASTTDLFELAKRASPEIADLTIRQFHARYPLQVKRRKALAAGSTGGKKKSRPRSAPKRRETPARSRDTTRARTGDTPAEVREAVRTELMSFAQALSSSTGDPGKLVELLAGIDRYVDRVIEASRK